MYCKECQYDLQGQQTPRCPECGAEFDFHNADTYYAVRIGYARRCLFWCRRHRAPIILVIAVIWGACMYIIGDLGRSRSFQVHPAYMSATNLKHILSHWRHEQDASNAQVPFDRKTAGSKMSRRPSPWMEPGTAYARYGAEMVCNVAPYFVVPTVVLILLIVPLLRRGRRCCMLVASGLLAVVLGAAAAPSRIAALLFPGSHAFVDDYVYIPDVDLVQPNTNRGKTVVAFDRCPCQTFEEHERRAIGFADGHVEWLWDERARPLFESQGLEYPEKSEDCPARPRPLVTE